MQRTGLCSTTCYKSTDDLRFQLAVEMLQQCRKYGVPTLIADGSGPEVKEGLAEVWPEGVTVVSEVDTSPGQFGPIRLQVLDGLLGWMNQGDIDVACWSELEKPDIPKNVERMSGRIRSGRADIVIPKRRPRVFGQMPWFQAQCEQVGNKAFFDITGQDHDPWIGPRFLSERALRLLLGHDLTKYGARWEVIFVFLIDAVYRGWMIESLVVDYNHPQKNLEEEEKIPKSKRTDQLHCLVDAMERRARDIGL